MTPAGSVERIDDRESLARFIMSSGHIRGDGTIKSNAFMPPPDLQMSVTRHLSLRDEEIWSRGQSAALESNRNLHGRGDFFVGDVRQLELNVLASGFDANPEHADVVGWPPGDKPKCMSKAQALAAKAVFVPSPPIDH